MVAFRNYDRLTMFIGIVLLGIGVAGAAIRLPIATRPGDLWIAGETDGHGLLLEGAILGLLAVGGAMLLAWTLVSRYEFDVECIRKVNMFGRTAQRLAWGDIVELRGLCANRGGRIEICGKHEQLEMGLHYPNLHQLALALRQNLAPETVWSLAVATRTDLGSIVVEAPVEFGCTYSMLSAADLVGLILALAVLVLVWQVLSAELGFVLLALSALSALILFVWRTRLWQSSKVVVTETGVEAIRGGAVESIEFADVIGFFQTSVVDGESQTPDRFAICSSDRSLAVTPCAKDCNRFIAAVRDRLPSDALAVFPWLPEQAFRK